MKKSQQSATRQEDAVLLPPNPFANRNAKEVWQDLYAKSSRPRLSQSLVRKYYAVPVRRTVSYYKSYDASVW